MAGDIAYLSGHIPEPVVQDAVLDKARSLGAPFLLRDIYRPLGLPRAQVQRVLGRLHAKGLVTRRKIPVKRNIYVSKAGRCVDGAAVHQMFLYTLVEGA